MSYVLTAYLVNAADLKSIVGSRDQSLIKAVEAIISETFEDDDEEAETQRAAVHALVMGEPPDPANAAAYGCALWHICKVKGEELLPDAWGGVRWDAVEACGLEDLLTKTELPVKLPPSRDIPHIGCICRDNVATYIKEAEEAREKIDPDVGDLLDEYSGWLEAAQSKNKDIVLFYG
jgi:hypothetical protein